MEGTVPKKRFVKGVRGVSPCPPSFASPGINSGYLTCKDDKVGLSSVTIKMYFDFSIHL